MSSDAINHFRSRRTRRKKREAICCYSEKLNYSFALPNLCVVVLMPSVLMKVYEEGINLSIHELFFLFADWRSRKKQERSRQAFAKENESSWHWRGRNFFKLKVQVKSEWERERQNSFADERNHCSMSWELALCLKAIHLPTSVCRSIIEFNSSPECHLNEPLKRQRNQYISSWKITFLVISP